MAINCAIMRGGTSKAVFLEEGDLPADSDERIKIILAIFGSPDRRQINGLGGGDPLTSKLAIIGRPDQARAASADLVYTFAQVAISDPLVDWHSLCGNISAAVGLYAIEERYVEPVSPCTVVRVFNTNLNRHLFIEVPVADGRPVERGDYVVPGVPGSGAKILIDFSDTAGAATGSLLPTSNPVDRVEVDGAGTIEMSLVDIGNAHVFVRASDVGLSGYESAAQIDADRELLLRLEAIRGAGAARMGMVSEQRASSRESPATPLLGIIAPPADYVDASNTVVKGDEIDLVSRLQFMQQTHKTYAGTSTVCTGIASRIPGTIVNELSRKSNRETVAIGHPAGIIETESIVTRAGDRWEVRRATLGRTARRIMDGRVYLPEAAARVAP